ncbi:dihydropteroate synthase [Selenomonas sp. TAMA-11512]|uniref:dihydropteroate synthase n=1 Tax=Selenomonas sp. TAMA-11512 TaxID=3095337 RepID=UPI003088A2E3|nr:dihydropteroate synthase [Selenomonas sp. TAMA-11512]
MTDRIKLTYRWNDGKHLTLGEKSLIMGILNVTEDSFSDGGRWNTLDKALRHALAMAEEGADIIDIGAESSRPGFVPISAEEEMERLLPFVRHIVPELSVPVSVDTFKARTADEAIAAGAHIINDIWGLQYAEEPGEMAAVAARHEVPVIVMHNRTDTNYVGDILDSIENFFRKSIGQALTAGVKQDRLVLDPGIGFGKTTEQNLYVMRHLARLKNIDGKAYPMLLGISRKSFIGNTLDLPVDERLEGTIAATVVGQLAGVEIHRVHDVKEVCRAVRLVDAIYGRPF